MKRSDEFRYNDRQIAELIKGKTVKDFRIPDDGGMSDWFYIEFTDGTSLEVRYDWIYEWIFREEKNDQSHLE